MLDTLTLPPEINNALTLAPLSANQFVAFWDETLFLVNEANVIPLCRASLPVENDASWAGHHLTPRLQLSLSGRFAALYHDFGRFGLVVDLQEKRVTMTLDRGDYQSETQHQPIAFFQKKGLDLLVHATDWNRLEISDPQKGEILTLRDAMLYESKTRPQHYLDYFHGKLLISSDGEWIADDGWVWHPVGVVATWNLENWLGKNSYESEDGESRRDLCWRSYLWNIPMAWVDCKHLAVWGLGEDEVEMADGARIFNASTGEETAAFPGPTENAFFGGDGRLFSVEEEGLHLWDATNGERYGRIEGFKPKWQRGDCLIELNGNCSRAWNWRTAFD